MRTRPLVAAAALIAAAALVATAGPAATLVPGPLRTIDPGGFRPLVIDRPLGTVTTIPDPDPGAASAGRLDPGSVIGDFGAEPVATARPAVDQPPPPIRAEVKPTWRRAEYSWYGPGFYGSGTACGQTYTKTILGVAHRTLPCGTRVTFRNPNNGSTITVRVIDRGPYVAGRMWDLSRATCNYLDNCYTSMIQYRFP
jgi:hypothetical protein